MQNTKAFGTTLIFERILESTLVRTNMYVCKISRGIILNYFVILWACFIHQSFGKCFVADVTYNGSKCSTNLAFGEIATRSRIECAILCKQMENCAGVFYSASSGQCVGCTTAMSAGTPLEPMTGSIYYARAFTSTIQYIGCYGDGPARAMSYRYTSDTMTKELCSEVCRDRGTTYFGLQASYECFCDNTYNMYGPSSNCIYACNGDSSQICGGHYTNSVYAVGVQVYTC